MHIYLQFSHWYTKTEYTMLRTKSNSDPVCVVIIKESHCGYTFSPIDKHLKTAKQIYISTA